MQKTLLLLLLPALALAHEFWLAPTCYRVAVGVPTPLRLLVGADFVGDAWSRPARKVLRFTRLGPGGATDTTDLRPALLADSLAPVLRCPAPGTHVVVLTSRNAYSELPGAQFTAYLQEVGLDLALQRRKQTSQTNQPGREAYHRCAKMLLQAGAPTANPADTLYRQVLGLPLELVPEQNPYQQRPGASLTVRLLHLGQPVGGALVQVWDGSLPGPARRFATRTNPQGRLLLRLPGPGPYLLAAVHMEAAPPVLLPRADWCSTWATLTFGGPVAGGR